MRRKLFSIAMMLTVMVSQAYAQMTMSFPNIGGVSTQTLNTGCTLVEFPVGTDLKTVMSQASFTVDGISVDASSIIPNPATLSLEDDQSVTFLYKGKAYGFRFSEGKYFTAVFLSDPHIGQDDHDGTSVADMQKYVGKIVNMGKESGAIFGFDALPGYVPTCDIAFSTGDMDTDNSKNHNDFKSAHAGFAAAGIPFISMCGNHDLVPDYWTGENPNKGLTYGWGTNEIWGGMNSNSKSINLIDEYRNNLNKYGISDVSLITDGSKHTQFNPYSFTFNGVRFYVGQTYWFQKPYDAPATAFSSAKYYAPDGVISALENFVSNHSTEPSVWMQHYPFLAGSDCDRWWLDQNDVGKYIKTQDKSVYGTQDDVAVFTDASAKAVAKKKKDKLAEIIGMTRNPVHFSGHTHQFSVNTYNGIKDYTTAASGYAASKGAAYIVLMKGNKGVVEVKQVLFSPDFMSGVTDRKMDLLPDDVNAVAAKLQESLSHLGADVTAQSKALESANNEADVATAVKSMETAFDSYIQQQGGKDVDVTKLLGENTDFETQQATANSEYTEIYPQAGWNSYVESFSNAGNKAYIKLQQSDVKGSSQGSKSLYLRAKWQDLTGKVLVTKQSALPAGIYKLKYYASCVGSPTQNLNYMVLDGKKQMLAVPAASAPQLQETTFTLDHPSVINLSFGFTGGRGGTENAVYIDDITLTYQGNKIAPNTDMTSLIQNVGFTEGTTSHQVQGSGGKVQVPNHWDFQYSYDGWNDTFVEGGLFNVWAGTIKWAELSQKVNLPNGAYLLTADVKTDMNPDESTIALYGVGGNGKVGRSEEVGKGNGGFNSYSCHFDVTDKTATIGIRSDKAYYQIKNIKLTYVGESADEQTANSYLRQDYYWNGRNAQEFDATGEKYAKARNVVVYPQVKNQLISAASIDQFSNTSNKIVNGVCQKLEITDQEKFFSSKDFVAEEAVFDRVFKVGQKSTVCLPFGPSTEKGKFYRLSKESGSILIFDEVSSPEGNTPYIYVASEEGKLHASQANIKATPETMNSTSTESGFHLVGVYQTTQVNNIYGFSVDGELLKASYATMNPFRSFIQSPVDVSGAKVWKASFDGEMTGIDSIVSDGAAVVDVLSLNGILLKKQVKRQEALDALEPGIYLLRDGNQCLKVKK